MLVVLRALCSLRFGWQEHIGKATRQTMEAKFLVNSAYRCLPDAEFGWRMRVAEKMDVDEERRDAEYCAEEVQVSEAIGVLIETLVRVRESCPDCRSCNTEPVLHHSERFLDELQRIRSGSCVI